MREGDRAARAFAEMSRRWSTHAAARGEASAAIPLRAPLLCLVGGFSALSSHAPWSTVRGSVARALRSSSTQVLGAALVRAPPVPLASPPAVGPTGLPTAVAALVPTPTAAVESLERAPDGPKIPHRDFSSTKIFAMIRSRRRRASRSAPEGPACCTARSAQLQKNLPSPIISATKLHAGPPSLIARLGYSRAPAASSPRTATFALSCPTPASAATGNTAATRSAYVVPRTRASSADVLQQGRSRFRGSPRSAPYPSQAGVLQRRPSKPSKSPCASLLASTITSVTSAFAIAPRTDRGAR